MILYAACIKKKFLHFSSKISGSSCYHKTVLLVIAIFSFTISIAQPTITSFSPSYGPVGSLVTISGTNLSNPTSFTIGGVAAIIVSNSGTSLVAMVMPGATTGGISISNAGGTANSSGNFTVIATLSPQLQQGNKLVATLSGTTPKLGHSVAISADGNTAIVGAKDDFSDGAAVVYTRSGNVWSQQGAKLVGTGGINSSEQGWSVAISADGNTAIVGDISDDGANGAAWIFTRTGTTWTQQGNKLVGTGNTGAAQQGYSVALSADGNTALVGAYSDDGSTGAVWVFVRTGTTWTQQGNKLVGSDGSGARQGSAVSISADGNTAIVGGRSAGGDIGAAWIFTRSGTSWSQQGNKLEASDNVGDAYFGTSVSISANGNTAVIGGYIDDSNQGAAWVFTRSGTTWSQQGSKLVGTGGVGGSQRGSSVGISADGNTIIIGAQSDNSNRGATWVFKRSGTTWSQQGSKLVGTGASGSARQGVSGALSADGNTAIIGGNEDNSDAGAAWVFIALNAPTITSFTPSNAKPSDVVTITGTNFNTTTTKNNVFFGATKATVSAATTTSLTVTVPTGATFDYITVLNTDNSLIGASKTKFTPVFSPSKTSITASSFQPKIDFAAGDYAASVAIGDLDGDGKADLVVANSNSDNISIYRNTSVSGSLTASSFAAKVDIATGTYPTSVAIGDIDGDSKPDLVVANGSSSNVSVFRNTSTSGSIGSGSFAAKVDFGVNTGPRSVAISDLDGDGKADLAVANGNAGNVSVLRNIGTNGTISSGSFADKVDFTVGTTPFFVTVGDIDGDGKPELVTANYNNNAVYVLHNTSTAGTISSSSFASAVSFSSGDAVYGVAIGDLDGDGKADLVAANGEDDDISVFRNTSTSGTIDAGSFATKVNFNAGNSPRSVAIGDFDGDGKPDLAVANISSNTVSVYRNTSTSGSIGSSSFSSKVDFSVGSNPSYVSIADIDGDGKSDLLLANTNSDNISILRNSDLPPTITSFTPSSAKPGDVVTIIGTNFNATTTNNIVFFGATRATVTAASTTSLTVTLPTGATYDYISVLNNATGLMASSKTKFTPIFAPSKPDITASSFQPKIDFASGTNPYAVAVGDLDGDGKPDMVVANFSSNTISVYRNTSTSGSIGASSFATKVDFTTGTSPVSVAIGDLDGDGKPDLAVTNYTASSVSIFRNTTTSGSIGSGSFAAKQDFTTGTSPISVKIGDLDGDGKPDLIVANYSANTFSILRNTATNGSISSGSFADKQDFITADNPYSVAIGDLDGDGKPELAVTNYSSASISIYHNTSTSGSIESGSFAAKQDFTSGSGPISVAIGDLDGDGKSDLAVANNFSSTVSIFRNTATSGSIGSGSFSAQINFSTGTSPRSVAMGDLDGDGKLDLAVANDGSNSASVLRNTSTSGSIGSGSFAAKQDFTTGNAPYSVVIGDLDGDGKPDLAVANYSSSSVSVFRNADLPPTITSFTPSNAKPGDVVTITGTNFNATTTNNIVFFGATRATVTAASTTSLTVTLPTGATYDYISVLNTVTTLSGASKTKFTPVYSPNKTNITTTDFQTKVDYANGGSPYAIAIGDLDGDGKPDLAVANNGNSTVSVYRNTSSSGAISASSFATKVDFSTGTDASPSTVAIGDLDGDGKLDLIVVNGGANNISVFRNTSTSGSISASSFAAKVDFATGTAPWAVAIGDLDGDGKPDLAVTNFQSASVSVFRNTSTSGSIGTGSFAAKVDFTTGTRPLTLAVGDLDGDGKLDLVIPNQLSASVSVLRNTSTSGTIESGSFAAKVDFTTGTNPYAVALGDLDADGKADMAVANHNSNSISLFRNTSTSGSIGSGSFAAKVDFTTGTNPFSLALGDLDGDGKADLAVANYSSNSISVFRNTSTSGTIGSGSFAAKVDFTTGTNPSVVAIGDLDGDSKADLAVTNYIGGNISVLRNSGIPTITTSGTLTAINTTYGTASANTSFSVSAIALTNNLLITAPTGYQVSTSISTGFASSITLIPSSGDVALTTIYVRIPGTTAVGTYSGNVVCTSSGATTRNVATVSSTVTAAALTITAGNVNKIYGVTLTGAVGSTAFTSTGLQNSETIGSVTVAYSTGAAATAAVGTYTGSATPSAATGGTFTASNYTITYATGNIIVNAAALTITATNQSKTYGSAPSLGTTMFSLTGILNTDAVTGVTLTSTGTVATANVGTYNIVPSAAIGTGLSNYTITYTNGTLTVNPATLTITATNQTKCFGFNLTLPTNGYTVSGILNSDAVNGVSLTSAGTVSTAAINTYPIIPSAAIGSGLSNYTINYINGVLTVASSITITTQPVTTITQCAGTTATINVVATGASSFTYQWFLNNSPITNATASSYSVSSLTSAHAGSYTVAVTPNNGCATVTSNASVWTVNSQPIPGPITIPSLVCTGLSYTLSNSVPGGVWSSSNMGVATIGAVSGVITPLSQGNTTISYATTNSVGCTGTTTAVLPVLSTPTKPVITRDFNGNLNSSYAGINIWYNASTQQTISGVSTSSYNPRANVRIQVQGNNGGCVGPISDEFIYTTSSIATIYPNPAGSFTVASIVSDRVQNIILQLTDMAGKLLQEIPVTLSTGQNPVRINTTTLAKGTYMLVIKGNGLTYIQFAKE